MTYRNEEQTLYFPPNPESSVSHYHKNYCSSSNSPRIDGKLKFKPNTLDFVRKTYNSYGGRSTMWSNSTSVQHNSFSTFGIGNVFAGNSASSWKDDIDYMAVTKFYSDLADIKLNLGQVLAERKQTIDLIATTAGRIANAYSSLRRGRNPFTGSIVNRNDASKYWLEYTYGWTPLLSDVYAAMEIEKVSPPPVHYKKSRTGNQSSGPYLAKQIHIYSSPPSWNSLNIDFNYYHDKRLEKYRICISADVSVSDPSVAFAQQLGLTNPALLAWELMPYSFVVDWFLPIGGWLSAQQALLGLSLSRTSVTRTYVCITDGHAEVIPGENSYAYGEEKYSSFEKYKTRSLDIPNLPLPRPKNPLSVSHALSSLALLQQVFGRK